MALFCMSVNHIAPSGPATISCGMKIPANLVKWAPAGVLARPAGPGAASCGVIPVGPVAASRGAIPVGPAIAPAMIAVGFATAGPGDPFPLQGVPAAAPVGTASAATIPAAHTSGI